LDEKKSPSRTPTARAFVVWLVEQGDGALVSRREIADLYRSTDTANRNVRAAKDFGLLEDAQGPPRKPKRGRPPKWYRVHLLLEGEDLVRTLDTEFQRYIVPKAAAKIIRNGEPEIHSWDELPYIALGFSMNRNPKYFPEAKTGMRKRAREYLGSSKDAVRVRDGLLRELAGQQLIMDIAGYDRPKLFLVGSAIRKIPFAVLKDGLQASHVLLSRDLHE
jgi:hypothetical protein